MGTFAKCCKGLFLTLLSVITMGLITAGFIAATVIFKTQKVDKISSTFFIVIIVVTVVSCLLFVFSLYASICGKKCAKTTLGVLFVTFAIIMLALGICLLAIQKEVVDQIGVLFNTQTQENDQQAVIEEAFKCCGWDNWICKGAILPDFRKPNCHRRLTDLMKEYGNIAGGVMVGLAVLLIIGSVFAFWKEKEKMSDITY